MGATIALAGNPNAGKTTLFNALTGARQHVGNYPGVTVEKKQGRFTFDHNEYEVVDLPGTYSLTAYSLEEVVARDFIVDEKPAVIVNIVDASNLERNLYLTLQFMEMGKPVCLALNMVDVAKSRGITINADKLSGLLGVPVVPTVARSGEGKQALVEQTIRLAGGRASPPPLELSYGRDLDIALDKMAAEIERAGFLTERYPARWVALKYLENDNDILKRGRQEHAGLADRLEAETARVAEHLRATLDTDPEAVIADHRYGYIRSLLKQDIVQSRVADGDRLLLSDKIDRVLLNRFAGPLIMVAVIFGLYHFTFTYSEGLVGLFEDFFGWLGGSAEAALPDGLFQSLIVSGVIDGVGGVLGFVPLIMFMFLGISLLEDSGYLARMAYMFDRVFRYFGLHGNSVMAFIVSGGIAGGCAVPGVMASRTLRSPRERLATLLTVPFMNCGAKLPVFALLVAAFFSSHEAGMMLLITAMAWVGALFAAKLLRMTVIRGEGTPFVMELPPYRLPTVKGLAIHTWERTWQYIKKAGTVILGISVLLWALMTFPMLPDHRSAAFERERQALWSATSGETKGLPASGSGGELPAADLALKEKLSAIDARESEAALRHSMAGRIGTSLEKVTGLIGFDWRTNIALVGGFAAKEVIVATLGTAYSLGEVDPEDSGSLAEKLAASPGWSPLAAFSLIVFTIFYAPCFVAVVCIAREAGSWKWGLFSMIFNTVLAFSLAALVFQGGRLLGL